ncbi:hypothetical protein N9996_04230 [Synechococcus sp. AH-603-M21]|nr:hypothetical protein [Synechococcus sp. AH-603-M21]
MNDSEFRSELVDALNTIAANSTHISKKIDVLNEELKSLKGINGNTKYIVGALTNLGTLTRPMLMR